MDRKEFDALAKVLATTPSSRRAMGALLGAGMAGVIGAAAGKGKQRKARRRGRSKTRGAAVAAEATCASPGPSSNLNGCNFNDDDLTGFDLSSSNLKDARFRGAILVRADLSSSNLKNADFRQADLTCANLRSSACGGANFNNATFCRTRTCNGPISDRDCPDDADLENLCCDCGDSAICEGGQCMPADVCLPPGNCPYSSVQAAVSDPAGPVVIRVAPGAYQGRFNIERNLTIIGAGSGPGGTVIDGTGAGSSAMGVSPNQTLMLRDLTISGWDNTGGPGGAMRIFVGAVVTLTRVLITNNTANTGGGIFNDGDLTLEAGTVITGNTSLLTEGGGIRNLRTVTLLPGSVVSGNEPDNCFDTPAGSGCP